jgi:protein-L-isoaspartate(D-aspartate) O-methyltransferase
MAAGIGRSLATFARLAGLAFGVSCVAGPPGAPPVATNGGTDEATQAARRERMVAEQIVARGVRDPRVLEAIRAIPRHRFVPAHLADVAYEDSPLPIGFGQTISQPYIVAYMSEELRIEPRHRVLEIGTGSGYQAAVLARLAREVYSVEIVPELAERARATLAGLGIDNVHVLTGDGYQGWPQHAPFDRVMATAAPAEMPAALVEQLAVGGRLIAPVGESEQWIRVLWKLPDRVVEERTIPVRFVPMVKPPQP